MRLAALTILIIGNLLANQLHADDVSTQPLTRVNCDKAEMAWDENAKTQAWPGTTLPTYAEKPLKLRR